MEGVVDCFVISDYTDLKEIADQLRALTDKTDPMSLGEMAAEASSANNHKTDILTALTEKGVDTSGAGLADIAGLVAAMETGGGVATGTITPTESVNSVEITHNLGTVPYIAIYYLEAQGNIRDETVANGTAAFGYSRDDSHTGIAYKTGSNILSSLSLSTAATNTVNISHRGSNPCAAVIQSSNEKTAKLHAIKNTSTLLFNAGNTYRWIMIARDAA